MRPPREAGAAVPEFVLVLMVLLPLVMGLVHLGLVLHVRTTLTAAASEGARAGAPLGSAPEVAQQRAQHLIDATLGARYARGVDANWATVNGLPVVDVQVHARVPALGLAGPETPVTVSARAMRQVAP